MEQLGHRQPRSFSLSGDAPDISVVMSVYNGAAGLRATVDSILSQKDASFEFIIVDDGSTDQTSQILAEYAQRDSRVRLIRQENQGLTKALCRGCAEARGEYIARQDVGDLSHPHRFFLQLEVLAADPSLVFVSSWTEFRGPGDEFLYVTKGTGIAKQSINIIAGDTLNGVIDGPSSHPSVMFRRDAYMRVGGYRAEFYYGQDWDLWFRLAEVGKFRMIESALYMARIMPVSISMEDKLRQEAISRLSHAALHQRLQHLPEEAVLHAASKIRPSPRVPRSQRRQAQALYFIGECLRRNRDSRSLAYFKQSIHVQPLLIKSWIRIAQWKLRSALHGVGSLTGRTQSSENTNESGLLKQKWKDAGRGLN